MTDELKPCSKCEVPKSLDDFYQSKGRVLTECKVCWKARVRARNALHPRPPKPPDERGLAWLQAPPDVIKARKRATTARNKKIVLELKATTPCADCGRGLPPWVMQFDHLNASTKDFNISRKAKTYISRKSLQAEIAKCEIVCGVCHAHRTYCRANGIEPYTLTLLPQGGTDA